MTPEERNVLLPLLDKLKETNVSEKDAEADQLIHQTLASKPDAAYILAQTVLMQDFALHQAQETIQQLKTQAQAAPQPSSSGSGGFLGGLFGGHSSSTPAQAQPQYQQPQYSQPQASPWGQRPTMQPSPYAQPMMAAVQPGSSGQPSFLKGAAQTAAGIAGGALLFDGISSLFGGHGGMGGGFGGGMGGGFLGGGGGGFGQPVETETINNYYDQPAPDSDMGVQGGDSNDLIDDNGGIDTSSGNDDDFGL